MDWSGVEWTGVVVWSGVVTEGAVLASMGGAKKKARPECKNEHLV